MPQPAWDDNTKGEAVRRGNQDRFHQFSVGEAPEMFDRSILGSGVGCDFRLLQREGCSQGIPFGFREVGHLLEGSHQPLKNPFPDLARPVGGLIPVQEVGTEDLFHLFRGQLQQVGSVWSCQAH